MLGVLESQRNLNLKPWAVRSHHKVLRKVFYEDWSGGETSIYFLCNSVNCYVESLFLFLNCNRNGLYSFLYLKSDRHLTIKGKVSLVS